MPEAQPAAAYVWSSDHPSHTSDYLWPIVRALVGQPGGNSRLLDVGCGNGWLTGRLANIGWYAVGLDGSPEGIEQARLAHPAVRFEKVFVSRGLLDAIDEEPFDVVVSTEVVEHLYAPREWAAGCFDALRPGGLLVCSTPYHGYLKNLAISLAGSWDQHMNPLWDGGHIKLWSKSTLRRLLQEAGFDKISFGGAGRVPFLWKSMVASALKPVPDKTLDT